MKKIIKTFKGMNKPLIKQILLTVVVILTIHISFVSHVLAVENNVWVVSEKKDDFGDPTGEKNLFLYTQGIFNNSATIGAKLHAGIHVVEHKDYGVYLHLSLREYTLQNGFVDPMGWIIIKFKNSKSEIFEVDEGSENSSMIIYGYDIVEFIKRSVGDIKCVIYTQCNSTYHFSFTADGFTKVGKSIGLLTKTKRLKDLKRLIELEKVSVVRYNGLLQRCPKSSLFTELIEKGNIKIDIWEKEIKDLEKNVLK